MKFSDWSCDADRRHRRRGRLAQPAVAGAASAADLLALWMVLTRRGRQAASVTGVGISTLAAAAGLVVR